MEFFDKLELNVSLNWSLIEHADKMCESIINANDDRMNLEDELRNSFELESSHITKDITDKLTQYDGLNIEKIYSIMMENKYPLKRTRHVCVKNTFDEILHIGLQPSKIDYGVIQRWVNEFYAHEFKTSTEKMFCGFILYLLYVRIHPHQDGNGRMGRYLFLENRLLERTKSYVPLSTILNNHNFRDVSDKLLSLYNSIDIKEKNRDVDTYYTLHLSDRHINTMLYIIYISIVYKHLRINIPPQIEEYEAFDEILCHYHSPLAGRTFLIPSEDDYVDMKTVLSPFIDLSKHAKILKVLDE